MPRTRIAVIDMPRMLRGIITELISAQSDLAIVAGVERADVAVTQLCTAAVEDMLEERPRLRIVAMSSDGREASVFELRPHEERLRDVSPDALLAAIRGQEPS